MADELFATFRESAQFLKKMQELFKMLTNGYILNLQKNKEKNADIGSTHYKSEPWPTQHWYVSQVYMN